MENRRQQKQRRKRLEDRRTKDKNVPVSPVPFSIDPNSVLLFFFFLDVHLPPYRPRKLFTGRSIFCIVPPLSSSCLVFVSSCIFSPFPFFLFLSFFKSTHTLPGTTQTQNIGKPFSLFLSLSYDLHPSFRVAA